jgi:hypothetical protein
MMSFVLMFAILQQAPALQDAQQQLGPFTISGKPFIVVVYKKQLANRSATVYALEIRNGMDDIEYARTFPYGVRDGHFQQTLSVSAKLVSRKPTSRLLIQYTTKPAPPGKNTSSQAFVLKNGKLVPLE